MQADLLTISQEPTFGVPRITIRCPNRGSVTRVSVAPKGQQKTSPEK